MLDAATLEEEVVLSLDSVVATLESVVLSLDSAEATLESIVLSLDSAEATFESVVASLELIELVLDSAGSSSPQEQISTRAVSKINDKIRSLFILIKTNA